MSVGLAPRPADTDLDEIDDAMTIGALMGEETNAIGMAIVAANALNRSAAVLAGGEYGFKSRSASLGDVFAAPRTKQDFVSYALGVDASKLDLKSLQAAVKAAPHQPEKIGKRTPGAIASTAQYSTTMLTKKTAGAFGSTVRGIQAVLGRPDVLKEFGFRYSQARWGRDLALEARKRGIDISFGTTNYGTKGPRAGKAGVGAIRGEFLKHETGPFAKGTTPPTTKEHAARVAAAASMLGMPIPKDIWDKDFAPTKVTPGEIATTASTLGMQSRLAMQEVGVETFPGMDFKAVDEATGEIRGHVGAMGLGAVDVPNYDPVTKGIRDEPSAGALGLGLDNVGINPAAQEFGNLPGSLMAGESWPSDATLDSPSETSGIGRFEGSTTEPGYTASSALNSYDSPSETSGIGRFDDDEDDEFSPSAYGFAGTMAMFDAPGGGVFDWGEDAADDAAPQAVAARPDQPDAPSASPGSEPGDGAGLGGGAPGDSFSGGQLGSDPGDSTSGGGFSPGGSTGGEFGGGGGVDYSSPSYGQEGNTGNYSAGGGHDSPSESGPGPGGSLGGGGTNAAGGQSSVDNSPDDRDGGAFAGHDSTFGGADTSAYSDGNYY